MDQPLISVIVPVYRVEKYLDQCISSIVSQTYQNLEIILVDDGSPDRSGAMCDAWAEKDSRIRVIHQQNAGGGAARNAALDVAQGVWVAFVDSDDYIAPQMLTHLYELVCRGADIAECGYVITEDDHASFEKAETEAVFYTAEEAMLCHIHDTIFRQLIWNKLYRREVLKDVRFPVGTKIDDEYFTYRALGNAAKLIYSPRCCYAYRQQPQSVMHQKNLVKCRESILAKQQRLAYLQQRMPQLADQAKQELLLTCVFCLQTYRKELRGKAYGEEKRYICSVIEKLKPIVAVEGSVKQKLLICASQHCPGITAAVLNFLIDIHILT